MDQPTQTGRQAQPPNRVTLEPQARKVVQVIRQQLLAQAADMPRLVADLHAEFPDEAQFVRGVGHGVLFALESLVAQCEEILTWE